MSKEKKAKSQSEKKAKKRINKGRLLSLLLITALCFYAVWTLISQQIEIQKTKKQLADLNAKLEQQNGLHDQLKKQSELINTPEYIEKTARDELGFAAPDEIIFKDASQE